MPGQPHMDPRLATRITIATILTLHGLIFDKILGTQGQFRGSNTTPPPAYEVQRLIHE